MIHEGKKISPFESINTYKKWLKLPPEDERYYSFLPLKYAKKFHERYKEKPHLYKRDEKDASDRWYGDDRVNRKANEYALSDFPYEEFMEKNLKYKKDAFFTFLIMWNDYIVLQEWHYYGGDIYYKAQWYMKRVMFIHKETQEEFAYAKAAFKNIYIMIPAQGVRNMGNYQTAYDYFYTHEQRLQHPDSIKLLKSLERFKYLPIEKFEKINYFKLLNATEAKIYTCELSIKSGGRKAASEILIYNLNIDKSQFKKYLPIIKNNRSLKNQMDRDAQIEMEKTLKKQQSAERLRLKDLNEELIKMKPLQFQYNDFIIMTPKDFMDMQFETNKLNHCVGASDRYLKKIVTGESMIFFLRKIDNPDDPFMTIEVDNREVIQVRGHTNATDNEITQMIKDWYMHVKEKLPICQV